MKLGGLVFSFPGLIPKRLRLVIVFYSLKSCLVLKIKNIFGGFCFSHLIASTNSPLPCLNLFAVIPFCNLSASTSSVQLAVHS